MNVSQLIKSVIDNVLENPLYEKLKLLENADDDKRYEIIEFHLEKVIEEAIQREIKIIEDKVKCESAIFFCRNYNFKKSII